MPSACAKSIPSRAADCGSTPPSSPPYVATTLPLASFASICTQACLMSVTPVGKSCPAPVFRSVTRTPPATLCASTVSTLFTCVVCCWSSVESPLICPRSQIFHTSPETRYPMD